MSLKKSQGVNLETKSAKKKVEPHLSQSSNLTVRQPLNDQQFPNSRKVRRSQKNPTGPLRQSTKKSLEHAAKPLE